MALEREVKSRCVPIDDGSLPSKGIQSKYVKHQYDPMLRSGTPASYFLAMFEDLFGELRRHVLAFIPDPDVADDIVSEVLWRVWQQRQLLQPFPPVRSYLESSIRNAALNYRRGEARRRAREAKSMQPFPATPEEDLIAVEAGNKYANALAHLPLRCRYYYQRVELDGIRISDLAKLDGVSRKAVEKQLTEARRRLSQALRCSDLQGAPQRSKGS
jgi:RNA polymerase sigma-70 factor (ECF subfamily)